MNKLTRISATVASSVALVAGFAGVAGASPSISTTGPDSYNRISHHHTVRTTVRNTNDVHLTNNNPQSAYTGRVEVERNTTVGDVSSGYATNHSTLNADVTVDNTSASSAAMDTSMGGGGGGMGDASIHLTGPDSTNVISSKNSVTTTVTNNNDIHVTNNNSQQASTGNVEVEKNTSVGNVTSGDATNTSNTTLSVNVTN